MAMMRYCSGMDRTYSDEELALAKAACLRYGPSIALKTLEATWPDELPIPHRRTLQRWAKDETIVVQKVHEDFWDEHEVNRRRYIQEALSQRFPKMLEMVDHLLEGNEAGKFQNAMIGIGITIDKLVPELAKGHSGVSFGNVGTVQLMVVAPQATERLARPVTLEDV